MRNIAVSTDTFAAIWSKRKPGEDSEDAILRRELGCVGAQEASSGAVSADTGPTSGGVVDARNGVTFPEGFRIFRHYKGREYQAEASHGAWVRLDDGSRYPTLNQLNTSIAAGAENVWNGNWKFRQSDGSIASIGLLRR